MRAVVQRVRAARVEVAGRTVGQIGSGLLVYVGVRRDDDASAADRLADKVAGLRIFSDADGKLNRSVRDVRGGVLAVPNFTLMADARKGRRPAFTDAAAPRQAQTLYERFLRGLTQRECTVEAGTFGAHMLVHSVADGPVNLLLEMPPNAPSAAAAGQGAG